MPTYDHFAPPTPEQRLKDLAALLAKGLVRALRRPADAGQLPAPENLSESLRVSLALPADSPLSVTHAPRSRESQQEDQP